MELLPSSVAVQHAMQLHAQLIKTNPNNNHNNHQIPCPTLLFLSLHLRVTPQHLTFPSLLSSAAALRSPPLSLQLHAIAIKSNSSSSFYDRHLQNSLIHLYSSSALFPHALSVFDRIPQPHRDVVSWTSIVAAAADADLPSTALRLFHSMQTQPDPIPPNAATVVSVLRACADLGAFSAARGVHRLATRLGLASEPNVVTALIDTYSKCGRIDLAGRVFDRVADGRDLFSWTTMIAGLASHGRSGEALALFRRMVESGLQPDERTITAALSACRSSGWVCEGYRIYNNISKFDMKPRIQHYGCMVDLLARAGHLDEAEGFLRRIPFEPDAIMWRNLIWASNYHKDIDRARRLIDEMRSQLQHDEGSSYVLMGNVYASAKDWEEKARVREMMMVRKSRVGKLPGCSRIEVKGIVHEFEAGDSKHPDRERIYRKWEEVAEELSIEGYKPNASEVLLDMEDEEKACQLHHHSEKLAVAFGLISTKPGEEILVVKNLRACEDCHSAMKLVSKVYKRKIVIRDRIRFHHFSNGSCSCRDYW